MKFHLRHPFLMALVLVTIVTVAALFVGCGTAPATSTSGVTPSATQQAITSTTMSYNAVDAAVFAADKAVKAGTLKGQDARNALKGLTDAKAGLDLALVTLRTANAAAAAAGPAASGATP